MSWVLQDDSIAHILHPPPPASPPPPLCIAHYPFFTHSVLQVARKEIETGKTTAGKGAITQHCAARIALLPSSPCKAPWLTPQLLNLQVPNLFFVVSFLLPHAQRPRRAPAGAPLERCLRHPSSPQGGHREGKAFKKGLSTISVCFGLFSNLLKSVPR